MKTKNLMKDMAVYTAAATVLPVAIMVTAVLKLLAAPVQAAAQQSAELLGRLLDSLDR